VRPICTSKQACAHAERGHAPPQNHLPRTRSDSSPRTCRRERHRPRRCCGRPRRPRTRSAPSHLGHRPCEAATAAASRQRHLQAATAAHQTCRAIGRQTRAAVRRRPRPIAPARYRRAAQGRTAASMDLQASPQPVLVPQDVRVDAQHLAPAGGRRELLLVRARRVHDHLTRPLGQLRSLSASRGGRRALVALAPLLSYEPLLRNQTTSFVTSFVVWLRASLRASGEAVMRRGSK